MTTRAASIARCDVVGRDLSIRMANGHHALARLRGDVGARDADEGADDLEAGLLLGLLDGADDRLDHVVGIDDDALLHAARRHDADADDFEVVLVGDLGDQRADLGGADVDANDDAIVAHRK